MRRGLTSLILFCLLCGGGLMLLGSKFGAERSIETTTADGKTMRVSLFDGDGVSVRFGSSWALVEAPGVRVELPTQPEMPEMPELPEIPELPNIPIPGGSEKVNSDLSGETITQLNVYAAVGEVTIQCGDSWAVSLDGFDSSYDTHDECLNVYANMGDVVVAVPHGAVLEWLSVESDAGSITLDGIQMDALEINQSMGETVLKNCSWGYADIENDCGSVSGTKLSSEGLEVSADMGEVDLEGGFTGETGIESSMGSVTLTLSGKQADYDIELESDLGSVTMNGHSSGRRISQSGGPDSLEVSCNVGAIEVRFAG